MSLLYANRGITRKGEPVCSPKGEMGKIGEEEEVGEAEEIGEAEEVGEIVEAKL